MHTKKAPQTYALLLLVLSGAALGVSALHPYDRATWWMEVAPVFIIVPILVASARRFPLTPLLYSLVALHAVILMVGGHYSYARVPAGFWVQDWLDLSRNPYDRLGHLAQGFVPAIAAREILLRKAVVRRGGWLWLFCTSICLAFSALYELIEWWAALLGGDAATDFLGTQGDPWDTQWDMFMALCGALLAQSLMPRWHDRQLAKMAGNPGG